MEEPEGIDLLGNGLIRLAVMRPGDQSKPCPQKGDVVDLEVMTVLVLDEEHKCSPNRTFRLGDGDECDALELVAPRMRPEEVAAVRTVPAAFGLDKSLCKAQPAAEVKAVVRLRKVMHSQQVAELSFADRLVEARKKKERGNWLFGREEFPAAGYSFNLGVSYIAEACHRHIAEQREGGEQTQQESVSEDDISLCCALYTNLALCQLKAEGMIPGNALDTCQAALALQPKNPKAWYLKAKAHLAAKPMTHQNRQDAQLALEYLLVLDPENKQAEELLQTAKAVEVEGDGADGDEYSFMNSRWYQWMVTGVFLAIIPPFFGMVRGDVRFFLHWLNDTAPEGMLASDPAV